MNQYYIKELMRCVKYLEVENRDLKEQINLLKNITTKIIKRTMTTDNGYTAEQVKEYYLNSGFTQYQEDEFISYSDLDWIEYANESELELN